MIWDCEINWTPSRALRQLYRVEYHLWHLLDSPGWATTSDRLGILDAVYDIERAQFLVRMDLRQADRAEWGIR